MPIIKEMFVPKELIKDKIDLLIENLTTIQDDSGEFLLDFDGMKVDDKSWSYGTGLKEWDYMVSTKISK